MGHKEDLGFIQGALGSPGRSVSKGEPPHLPEQDPLPVCECHPPPPPSDAQCWSGGSGVCSLPSPRPAPAQPPPTLPTSEAPRSRTVCCKPRNVSRSARAGNVSGEEGKGGEPREESWGDTESGHRQHHRSTWSNCHRDTPLFTDGGLRHRVANGLVHRAGRGSSGIQIQTTWLQSSGA